MIRYFATIFAALAIASLTPAAADVIPKNAVIPNRSTAEVFPYEASIMDLLVTGPAARSLYEALPGKGTTQACGATGLHKGDGKMSCAKNGNDYACHVWLDMKSQTLASPEIDDC